MAQEELDWASQVAQQIATKLRPGQRFLGTSQSLRRVELVFDLPPGAEYNLITLSSEGLSIGFVAQPEAYVDPTRDWLSEVEDAP